MRDYLTPAQRRTERRKNLRLEAEARAKTPGTPKTYNQWMELRFTGRVKQLGVVMTGDVASRQHQIVRV